MKLVVGLGNPGNNYQHTRHNAGFMLLDLLAVELGVVWNERKILQVLHAEVGSGENKLILLKPQGFMNHSGQVIGRFWRKTAPISLENLFIAHDDLDLPLGEYKLQFGKGPHEHNGLLSIYQNLGTKDFWHVRIGVDARAGRRELAGHQYLLQPFPPDEKLVLDQTLIRVLTELKNQVQW